MPGSDRCAVTRPSRARVGPQNRTMQARKPGPYPRRPPRAAGRPDDFADHSCGYPRPSRAAGRFYARQRPLRRHPRPRTRASGRKIERRRHGSLGRTPAAHRARQAGFMPGSDRCAAILVPSRARQAGFMAAATVAPPPAPPARASGRKIERCKRESLGRTPAALPRASGRLTILPTIPADTRAPPTWQAGFMSGSDRCAAILVPSRARQTAKSSDAGAKAGAVPQPPTARGRPA